MGTKQLVFCALLDAIVVNYVILQVQGEMLNAQWKTYKKHVLGLNLDHHTYYRGKFLWAESFINLPKIWC